MNLLWVMLSTMAAVQCDIDMGNTATSYPSQFHPPNNNVNYVLNPDQSFTNMEDRQTLHTPYGFYGMPLLNQPLNHQPPFDDVTIEEQQQMKVKKDINRGNVERSLVLDDIR